jgi:hypothetical protein
MGPQIRIIARYGVGWVIGVLCGRGLLPAEMAQDPELVGAVVAVGAAVVGAATEWVYNRAKKTGGDL